MAALVFAAVLNGQRKQGSPLEHLPRNIEVLTHFGERADFSPDNRRVAFMNKSFGDAFVVDVENHMILLHRIRAFWSPFAPLMRGGFSPTLL
jgi:hypothetical protein